MHHKILKTRRERVLDAIGDMLAATTGRLIVRAASLVVGLSLTAVVATAR